MSALVGARARRGGAFSITSMPGAFESRTTLVVELSGPGGLTASESRTTAVELSALESAVISDDSLSTSARLTLHKKPLRFFVMAAPLSPTCNAAASGRSANLYCVTGPPLRSVPGGAGLVIFGPGGPGLPWWEELVEDVLGERDSPKCLSHFLMNLRKVSGAVSAL